MQSVIDPVCGMSVDPETAAGHSKFEDRDYYFCSVACKEEFDRTPAKFRYDDASVSGTDTNADDPPFTNTHGFVAPKFGAAGSGGAEYEPLPGDRKHLD